MIRRRSISLVLLAATAFAGCMPAGGGGPGGHEHGGPPGMTPQPMVQAAPVTPSPVPRMEGYNSAIKAGLAVFISGQMSLDSQGELVGENDRPAQINQSLTNLCALVRAAHGLPADVVKLTYYVVDYDPGVLKELSTASAAFFPDSTAPAVTVVGVTALPVPEALVAVDGVAILHGQVPDHNREYRH